MGLRVVRNSLQRQGVKIRDGRFFNEDEDREIAKLYQNGMSLSELANHYNLTNDRAILNSLIRTETPRRENRTYFFNEHAFSDLNSEYALYWLGFIYADGNVTKHGLRITLSAEDRPHLSKLRDFMNGDMPIFTKNNPAYPWKKIVTIAFYSTYLASYLANLGIVAGRKHLHLIKPHIPIEFTHHFIRGYLDGDGCLSVNQQVVFLGKLDMLTWIRDILHKYAGASDKVKIRERRGTYEVSWGGRLQSRQIITYLYKDTTIWLDRKRKITNAWK